MPVKFARNRRSRCVTPRLTVCKRSLMLLIGRRSRMRRRTHSRTHRRLLRVRRRHRVLNRSAGRMLSNPTGMSALQRKIMGTIAQPDLYDLITDANARGERVVVATVAHTRGSTPQRRGAKMLFFENGETAGTVGGGCIEAEVWAEATEALRSG